jgi:hypothetical protein
MMSWLVVALAFSVSDPEQKQPPSRAEVVEKLSRWRDAMFSEFHVKYEVHRRIVREAGPYDYAPKGNAKKEYPLMLHWGGDHAWQGESSRDITVADPVPGDFESQAIGGKFAFNGRAITTTKQQGASIAPANRSTSRGNLAPEEEFFLEMVGFESRCQDYGVTLRGYKNPLPYDLLTVAKSPGYSMTLTPEQQLRFEAPGVDSFTLDPAHGFSLARRKWTWPKGNQRAAFVEIENSDWHSVDESLWVPFSSTVRYFAVVDASQNPVLVLEDSLTVVSASTHTSENLFVPKLRHNAVLVTPDGKAVFFRGQGQEDVKQYLSDPATAVVKTVASTRFRALFVAGAVLLAAALLAAAVFYYRRARKATP